MAAAPSTQAQVAALDRGDGVLDMDGWTVVGVSGPDALGWLNDLVTADVAGLAVGAAVRSLLLGPTGRIRADLLVHRGPDRFLLVQTPGQPRPIDELLDPYVLSSDVELGRPDLELAVMPAPSGRWAVATHRVDGTRVGTEAFESWRIRRGWARFPVDLDEDSLPAEAGLDEAPIVDRTKGCYLGQESVAKVRNLGHPTRVILTIMASEPVVPGVEVLADGSPVGLLTSVDGWSGRIAALARIRWEARAAPLSTVTGVRLIRR